MPTNPTDFVSPKKSLKARSSMKNPGGRPSPFSMGPPTFAMPRRGFANGAPFSPQRFTFAGPPPAFGPMPPPPGMPLIPLMGPPPYGPPRPFRYGAPPMHAIPAIPPTPPGFPHPSGFPSCIPGPPRMKSSPRLSSSPVTRLPPSKILPSLLPPPPPLPPSRGSSRTAVAKQLHQKKKQHLRNGIMEHTLDIRSRRNGSNKIMPKTHKEHKEQDFTVDTFEENLATSTPIHPRRIKRRFSRNKWC